MAKNLSSAKCAAKRERTIFAFELILDSMAGKSLLLRDNLYTNIHLWVYWTVVNRTHKWSLVGTKAWLLHQFLVMGSEILPRRSNPLSYGIFRPILQAPVCLCCRPIVRYYYSRWGCCLALELGASQWFSWSDCRAHATPSLGHPRSLNFPIERCISVLESMDSLWSLFLRLCQSRRWPLLISSLSTLYKGLMNSMLIVMMPIFFSSLSQS